MAKRVIRKVRRVVRKRVARRNFNKLGGQISTLRGNNLPDRMLIKFKYADVGQTNTSIFDIKKQYRLNSIYDPNYALGGTSCAGFAQWRNLYSRYRVYKVDYAITLVNVQGAQSIAGAVVPAPATFTLYNYGELATQPMARSFLLAPVQGMNRKVIKGSIYLPRLEGLKNNQYMANENMSSVMSGNPPDSNFLYIISQQVDNGASGTPNVLQWSITMTFHTELYQRKSAYVDTFTVDLSGNEIDAGRLDSEGNPIPPIGTHED